MILRSWMALRIGFAVTSTLDVDGVPLWPVANLNINGFANTVAGQAPAIPSDITLTCNGAATDAHDGTTYDWYLSQRTDDLSKQCWLVSESLTAGKSGTLRLNMTAIATRILSTASPNTSDSCDVIANRCDLYVQRKSDMAIQYYPLRSLLLV